MYAAPWNWLVPRLVVIWTWEPDELLKSEVWLLTDTLNSSMLSTGVGMTPEGLPLVWLPPIPFMFVW